MCVYIYIHIYIYICIHTPDECHLQHPWPKASSPTSCCDPTLYFVQHAIPFAQHSVCCSDICVCAYVYVCVYTFMCVHMYGCVCMNECMYVCVFVQCSLRYIPYAVLMSVCVYTCMYMYVSVYCIDMGMCIRVGVCVMCGCGHVHVMYVCICMYLCRTICAAFYMLF